MGLLSARRTSRRALTAAGALPTTSNPADGRVGRRTDTGAMQGSIAQSWQYDAQALTDSQGPLKFTAMYRGNMYRRVRIHAAVIPDGDGKPIPIDDILDPTNPATAPAGLPDSLLRQAQVELARIRQPQTGRAGLLYDFGYNHTTCGDAWLVVEPDEYEPNGERWDVYSVTELLKQGTWPDGTIRWQIVGPPSRTLAQGACAWRIYQPHPHRHSYADAPTLGVLDDLEELALIKRAFRGAAKSRLAAGILAVASELDFGTVDPDDPDSPDNLTVDLLKQLTTPVSDEASAANLVPFILRGAKEYIGPDALRLITLDRPGDKVLDAREDKALKRFAIGMDTPPEQILGIGDINHWGAFQVSESSWKAHGEPGMIQLCGQLGAQPLRSLLNAAGLWSTQQVGRITTWYDASDLVDHPDQFADAVQAHDRVAISDAALRKHGNFQEEDKPSDQEVAQRINRKRLEHSRGADIGVIPTEDVAGPVDPRTIEAPARQGPPTAPPAEPRTASAAVRAARSVRPIGRTLTDLDLALYNRLHGMCQAAIHRQLERAGAQITSRAQRTGRLAAQVRSIPKPRVAATIGRQVVASLGLDDQQLIGDYDDLLDQADQQTSRTRDSALVALIAAMKQAGVAPSEAVLATFADQAGVDQLQGRARLEQALRGYTLQVLYAAEGEDLGELPAGLVRAAIAVYGGQLLDEAGYPVRPDRGVEPLRGVATGTSLLGFAAQTGAQTELWEWLHFTVDNPFLPHLELDGQVFGGDPGADEQTLAGPTEIWTSYAPGDHAGCLCLCVPALTWGSGVGEAA